jgi:hypothetical protein
LLERREGEDKSMILGTLDGETLFELGLLPPAFGELTGGGGKHPVMVETRACGSAALGETVRSE